MADMTFQKLGTGLLANKLVTDYRDCKRSVPSAELEHFAQNWLDVWVDGDDYKEVVFAEAMRLLSNV